MGKLHARVLPAIVAGVAMVAVQALAAHAHVRARAPVAKPRAAHRAREAPHVVAEGQRFDYHGGTATCT